MTTTTTEISKKVALGIRVTTDSKRKLKIIAATNEINIADMLEKMIDEKYEEIIKK